MDARQQTWLLRTPRWEYESRGGIKARLENRPETALKEITALRQLHCELHPQDKLIEFVIDGRYLLERHGETHRIIDPVPNLEVCKKHKVLVIDDFLEMTKIGSYHTDKVDIDIDDVLAHI